MFLGDGSDRWEREKKYGGGLGVVEEEKKREALKKIQLRILYACCYFNYTSQEVLNEKREKKKVLLFSLKQI